MLQRENPDALTVDLSEVPYIDSSGIATLIEALKIARNHETTLRLAGLQQRLLHLLEVTGVLSLFEAKGHASLPSASRVS
jgi:anti-sigma B factor antagonist